MTRRAALVALASAVVATIFNPADLAAHAIILESSPGVGAKISASTLPIRLRFNSRIDQKRSLLVLRRAGEPDREIGLLPSGKPEIIQAEAPGLSPGDYQLHWQVLSVDGHITRGNINFSIVP